MQGKQDKTEKAKIPNKKTSYLKKLCYLLLTTITQSKSKMQKQEVCDGGLIVLL